ncbi:efflux RND transporter periplasmic adaptor subunit [Vibrio rotiferianus]|uniref:efflux RND transporter periplasmic adaptor subunit n=1 Tax=Vibrio rotiferianus TaxID=190895 RepID=UPI001110DE47|nr:efflux RND transporter periplasmic adaptor subunit [Vibrio rotiferianus]TMX31060.1 efflux RND transporter periplasmic adaptor subunit [Vibrio rotiferianus]TMX43339.1 efflux RND transporter periplasmic adaptor subunit [Vibrio rotiferianus]TMX59745.1 efflux RND transporter periplasmic adaptor subunit [Vibrio rotiferianus]
MVATTFGQNKLKLSAISALLISSLSLTGCSDENEVSDVTPLIKPALIEVVTTQSATELSFNGIVRAAESADLAFRVGGKLINIFVKEGDEVSKGQLLASLDDRDAKNALVSAQLEFENVSREYERAQAVFKKSQAISKADLDTITTRYNLARTRVEDAKRHLEYTQIFAPFDGIVGRKLVDNYVQVQANEPILTVHDINDLEVVIHIPHKVMLSGKEETRAIAEISAIPGQSFPLKLRTVATVADPVSQAYPVVLGFEHLNGFHVLPGMAVKVLPVSTSGNTQNQQITLPLTSIVPDNQGKQFVWIVGSDNKAQKRYVAIGALNKDRIIVTEHLSPGEQVIIAGVSSVKEGMEVRPYTDDRAGAQ